MATSAAPAVSPDVARLVAASEAGLAKREQLAARLARDAQSTISRLGSLEELETRTRTEIHRVNGMIATVSTRRRQLESLVETRNASLETAIANGADPATLRSRTSSFRRILTGNLPPELLTPLRMPQAVVAHLRANMPPILQRLTVTSQQSERPGGTGGPLSAATKALTVTGPAGMPASPVSRSSAFADSGSATSGGSPTSRSRRRTMSRTMSGRALEASQPVDPDTVRSEAAEVEAGLAAVQKDADALSTFSQQLQAADAQLHHAMAEALARESDIAPTFEALTEAIETAQAEIRTAETAAAGGSAGTGVTGSVGQPGGPGGGITGMTTGATGIGDGSAAAASGTAEASSGMASAVATGEGKEWDAALDKARTERAVLIAGSSVAAAGGVAAAGAVMASHGAGEGKTSAADADLPGPEVEQAGATLPPMQLDQATGATSTATTAEAGVAASTSGMEISTTEPQRQHAYTVTQSQPRSPTPVGSVMPDHESQLAGATTADMDIGSLEAAAEMRGADEAEAAVIAAAAARATSAGSVGHVHGIPIKPSQAHSPTPVASVMPGGPDFRDATSPPLGLRDVMGSPSDIDDQGAQAGVGGAAGGAMMGAAAAGAAAGAAGAAGVGIAGTGVDGQLEPGVKSPETVVAGESAREASGAVTTAAGQLQPGQEPILATELPLDTSAIPSSPPLENALEGAEVRPETAQAGIGGGATGVQPGSRGMQDMQMPITTASAAPQPETQGAQLGAQQLQAGGGAMPAPGATMAAQQAAAAIASQTGFAGTAVTMAPLAVAAAAPGAAVLGTGTGTGAGTGTAASSGGDYQATQAGMPTAPAPTMATASGAAPMGTAGGTMPQGGTMQPGVQPQPGASEGAVGGMSGVQPPQPIHIPQAGAAGAAPGGYAGGQQAQQGSARAAPVACLDRCCIVQ